MDRRSQQYTQLALGHVEPTPVLRRVLEIRSARPTGGLRRSGTPRSPRSDHACSTGPYVFKLSSMTTFRSASGQMVSAKVRRNAAQSVHVRCSVPCTSRQLSSGTTVRNRLRLEAGAPIPQLLRPALGGSG